jgi:DNA polymerase elongation subunit (family B)
MRYLILDLETLPITNAADFVTLDDISAPSNYKDPEKIAAYVEAERVKRIEAAALDLDLAQIIAIGLCDGDGAASVWTPEGQSEAAMISLIADQLRKDEFLKLVTFNGFKYDLPLIQRRARYLGVDFPRINLDRYRSPHIDLYEELTLKGAVRAHGLRWYARRHGWTDLLDADPLTDGGADVAQAAKDGRWEDIAAHAKVDAQITYRLALWLGVITPEAREESVL